MYKFSIIVAVYDVEAYLEETIQSLINQTIGFKDAVQLILINDGSPDNSGNICEKYKMLYPENIVYVKKENGGVASARNLGLSYVKGKYVNFLDSDDTLSENALSEVWDFFEKHYDEVDLVSIPLVFFDRETGNHILNYKYEKGSRVVDLNIEYDHIQLSLSSSFVKSSVIENRYFDEKLKYAEDAKLAIQILSEKNKLGVVASAQYNYRRRSGDSVSAMDKNRSSSNYYLDCLNNFTYSILSYFQFQAPNFVQYTLMYDLQWRFKFSTSEIESVCQSGAREYIERLYNLLNYIDDRIILEQKYLSFDQKYYLLKKKYNDSRVIYSNNDIGFMVDKYFLGFLSDRALSFNALSVGDRVLHLDGEITLYGIENLDKIKIMAVDNSGNSYESHIFEGVYVDQKFIEKKPLHKLIFQFTIPLEARNKFNFYLFIDGLKISPKRIAFSKLFPLSFVPCAYAKEDNFLFFWENRQLCIELYSVSAEREKERKFIFSLIKEKSKESLKAAISRSIRAVIKPFVKNEIWLVSDRINKADDNGEVFFKYLYNIKAKEHVYFVLQKESPDYERVKTIGKVVDYLSWKHKLLHILADQIISSGADDYSFNPFFERNKYYKDILASQKRVFLQHGITKDDLSDWLNKYNKGLSTFVTAAKGEYESIIEGNYYYDESVVKLTGFPRYDLLEDRKQKVITIMPTWRLNLVKASDYAITGKDEFDPSFLQTDYYHFYNNLINDSRLLAAVKEYNYRIRFMPHPRIIPYIDSFNKNEFVEFCHINTRYNTIFAESALVVTDYSSVAFDFAYLRKPIVYCQFDQQTFFDGHTYDKGYFDYERDGFGEVETSLNSTVSRIIEYIEKDCKIKDKYNDRINQFFAFSDQNNCERVYKELTRSRGE